MTLWWWLKSTWWQLSYWLRPYDMLADARRWRWAVPTPCILPAAEAERLIARIGHWRCWCACPSPITYHDAHSARRWCGECLGLLVDSRARPCVCGIPPTIITVDANGHSHWCGTCGGRL